jgi:hypothetical protein
VQVVVLTGYAASGRGFNNYLGAGKTLRQIIGKVTRMCHFAN